jgi:hypothetical protein
MPLIWRFQFHKILLNSNNDIDFGQDNGILANTKIGAIKKPLNIKIIWSEVYGGMLVCGM